MEDNNENNEGDRRNGDKSVRDQNDITNPQASSVNDDDIILLLQDPSRRALPKPMYVPPKKDKPPHLNTSAKVIFNQEYIIVKSYVK